MSNNETAIETVLGRNGSNRRTVLKALAASGVLSTALAGTATAKHGKGGGTLLTVTTEFGTGEPQIGVPFFMSDAFAEEFEFPASCHASESQLKSYLTSVVLFYPDLELVQIAAIRSNKKHLDMDSEMPYEFTSSQECKEGPEVWRGTFKPART